MNAGRVKSGTGHVACSVARCCRCVKTAAPIDDDDDVVWGGAVRCCRCARFARTSTSWTRSPTTSADLCAASHTSFQKLSRSDHTIYRSQGSGSFELLLLLHRLNGLFSRTALVSRYQKGKTSMDLNETRDDRVLGYSGIRWTICRQSAPRSRQIATPTPHHSNFTGRIFFLTPNQHCQRTEGNPVSLKQTPCKYKLCAASALGVINRAMIDGVATVTR